MPRRRSDHPTYRFHTASGQACVTLCGKVYYLGKFDTPKSYARYHALLGVYLANGKSMPKDDSTHLHDAPITVRVITADYRQYAAERWPDRRNSERNRADNVCDLLDDDCGDLPADEFGPRKLAEIRDGLVGEGLSRAYVNRLVRLIRRVFRRAISRELIDVNVVVRLDTLQPLRAGETSAPETEPVQPVDLADLRATAEYLSPILKAMVELQAATGMRPSEVCNLRPLDIDRSRSDGIWMYRPHRHKTKHRGKSRAIPIVGDVRITIGPYLDRDADAYCFSPLESVDWFRQQQRSKRKTAVPLSQQNRQRIQPKRQPGEKYTADSYRQALQRAAARAGVERWFPYQLRHTAATAVREALGIEAAQALLGHSRTDMTDIYAQRSEERAIEAANALLDT